MSVETIKVCKCDICGKVLSKETGYTRWYANVKLGSNVREADSVTYEDVCDECANAIRNVIQERSNKKETYCEEKAYANEWMVTYADIR